MSDRYNYPDDSHAPGEDEELLGALLAKHAARCGEHEAERESVYAEEPLRMSQEQIQRMWLVLSDEVGPISASKILKRIQREV